VYNSIFTRKWMEGEQEPGTPASNISREPEEVEEMLRMSEDEGEGDERSATEREPVGAELPGDSSGSGAGSGPTAPGQQPARPMEQQPLGDDPQPSGTQEGNKNTTLSLSEIKKAVMDISNSTGTSTRARSGSDPGIPIKFCSNSTGKDATEPGTGSGYQSGSGSGGRTATNQQIIADPGLKPEPVEITI
jgi:hypothetical protein